jgi:hypothetical protein
MRQAMHMLTWRARGVCEHMLYALKTASVTPAASAAATCMSNSWVRVHHDHAQRSAAVSTPLLICIIWQCYWTPCRCTSIAGGFELALMRAMAGAAKTSDRAALSALPLQSNTADTVIRLAGLFSSSCMFGIVEIAGKAARWNCAGTAMRVACKGAWKLRACIIVCGCKHVLRSKIAYLKPCQVLLCSVAAPHELGTCIPRALPAMMNPYHAHISCRAAQARQMTTVLQPKNKTLPSALLRTCDFTDHHCCTLYHHHAGLQWRIAVRWLGSYRACEASWLVTGRGLLPATAARS